MKQLAVLSIITVCCVSCLDLDDTVNNANPLTGNGSDNEISEINDSLKGTWDLYDSTGSVISTGALTVTDTLFGMYSGQPTMWKLVAANGQVYIEAFSNGAKEYYYDYSLAHSGAALYLLPENTGTYTNPGPTTSDVLIYKKQS